MEITVPLYLSLLSYLNVQGSGTAGFPVQWRSPFRLSLVKIIKRWWETKFVSLKGSRSTKKAQLQISEEILQTLRTFSKDVQLEILGFLRKLHFSKLEGKKQTVGRIFSGFFSAQ